MKILLLEPFFSGSHQQWAESYQHHSSHSIDILSLPGRHWKWRMYGGAVALATQFDQLPGNPDLLLATDMLDLTTFMALTKKRTANIPLALYFHENQITYPWSPVDRDVALGRNNQYGFINYTSALAADRVFFNSAFHKSEFLRSLPGFLRQFPDQNGLGNVSLIEAKSEVLPLGLDLKRFDLHRGKQSTGPPVILWNHRWEYDKDPDSFFNNLLRLKAEGINFRLIVMGESYKKSPPVFAEAKKALADHLLHFRYARDFSEYAQLLWQADILPVTSRQDFFGGSTVEAIYCNCYPILPNRLAFPEHLPEAEREQLLYNDDESFYEKLKWAVQNIDLVRQFEAQHFVAHYDWSRMVQIYDDAFSRLV